MKLRFRSIRQQLLGIVAITIVAALLFSFLGNVAGDIWSFHKNLLGDMVKQSELLGRLTSAAIGENNPQKATQTLKLLAVRPNVLAAAIYDEHGKLFASYAAPEDSSHFPSSARSDYVGVEGNRLLIFKSILDEGRLRGTVYMRVDHDLTNTVVEDIEIGLFAFVLAILVGFLMINSLEKFLTNPISDIANAAREVVATRDYSRRVEKVSDDEIGILAQAFNTMLTEIERRTTALEISNQEITRESDRRKLVQQEIMELNEDLESRVHDRTADLEMLNQELSRTTAMAEMASRAKSDFLATMSHEIRTPMNGVIGMIDVLHQTSLNGYQVEMVDLIRDSGFSLLTIIDDILDFSKIEAGRLELEATPFSVADLTEKACGMLDHVADKKGVVLTLFVDPNIPEILIGDGTRIRQVLVNLVSNAIKFSSGREQTGLVGVRVVLNECSDGQAEIEIQVSDNGIGMDEATQARLFTAFTQADTSITRRFGGTGLGLAISRHLVDLMNGQLLLHSTPGQGSLFTVRLTLPGQAATNETISPFPALAGLNCLVLRDGLGDDIAAHLAHIGVRVRCIADLNAVQTLLATEEPGLWVWIIDTVNGAPPMDPIKAMLGRLEKHDIRLVVVGRGARREPYVKHRGLVEVDGNVLTRSRLFHATALAAGLEIGPPPVPEPGQHAAAFKAPSHLDALRDGQLILVAEDNETNQKVIVRQLALLGYAADVAANGRAALIRWQEGCYALLLTDLHMPEMDGFELTERIRTQETGNRRLPILALTANTLKGEAQRCREAGMDDYLSKPLELAALKKAIERWMPAAKISAGLVTPNAAPGAIRPVDVGILKNLVGDDPEVIVDFLDDFSRIAIKIGKALQIACAGRQAQQAAAQAHKLKSSALTVGAMQLGALCAQIELAGNAGDLPALAALSPAFEQELAIVIDYLTDFQVHSADRRHAS